MLVASLAVTGPLIRLQAGAVLGGTRRKLADEVVSGPHHTW